MNKNSFRNPKVTLSLVGAVAMAAGASAQTTPTLENYIEFGGGAAWTSGSAPNFKQKVGVNPQGFGGITGLYLTKSDGDNSFVTEAHGILGNGDFGFDLDFKKGDKIAVKIGYREFNTWYAGAWGPYIPASAGKVGTFSAISLGSGDYDIARRQFDAWITYKPREGLQFDLGFEHTNRSGQKSSTIEGATSWTGITNVVGTSNSGQRNIVPAFYNISERNNAVIGKVTLTSATNVLEGAIRLEKGSLNNSYNYRHNPFEKAATSPDRYATQTDGTDHDLFAVHLSEVNRLNDKVTLSGAYSYTSLNNDIGGSRIFGIGWARPYDPSFNGPSTRGDTIYWGLAGSTKAKERAGNFAVMYTPNEKLQITPSVRIARISLDAADVWFQTSDQPIATPRVTYAYHGESEHAIDEITGAVEARYTGLKNVVVVLRGESAKEKDEYWRGAATRFGSAQVINDFEHKIDAQKVTGMLNWYPSTMVSASAVYTYDARDHKWDGASLYLKEQRFERNNFGVRFNLRPTSKLTYTARYDIRETDIDNMPAGLASIQSAKISSRILSQSITWTPANWVYLQGALNRVDDKINTPADTLTNSATVTQVGMYPDDRNDYWNTSLSVGVIADEKTNLVFSYDYNTIDNWIDTSALTVPYGASSTDRMFRVTATRRLSDTLLLTAEYAHAKGSNKASNGLNDYRGNLFVSKLQYRF